MNEPKHKGGGLRKGKTNGGRTRARQKKSQKNLSVSYVSGKIAHDLRYANDTDAISLAVMDNDRVVTAHKDLNIVCWNILEGKTRTLRTRVQGTDFNLFYS